MPCSLQAVDCLECSSAAAGTANEKSNKIWEETAKKKESKKKDDNQAKEFLEKNFDKEVLLKNCSELFRIVDTQITNSSSTSGSD